MIRNHKCKHKQQNTSDGRENLKRWRYHRGNRCTSQDIKFSTFLTQNIQEIWNTTKIPNLRIIGIDEREVQLKGTESVFNKMIEENFPNLKKDMPMKVQEAYRIPNILDQRKVPSRYKNQNTKHTE